MRMEKYVAQNFNQMWPDPEAQEEGKNCRFILTKLYF